MKIITCNFCGRKHSERNEQCEDSVYYLRGSEVTTVSVADGAGSKKYEHAKEGADAVTRAICNFFEMKFDDFFDSTNELELRSVIQTICHKALKDRAKELGIDTIETMASTLLAVSIKGNKAICVQIGDGIVGRSFHGEPEIVTMPQNGEFASSTYFVNSNDAYKMIQVRKMFLSGTSHFFLMTDGVSDCMFNDFTGVFNDSLKMILEASEEPDGEEKVNKAVKDFIVDADPMSDDCTLAVICFNEKSKKVETETLTDDNKHQVDQPVVVSNPVTECEQVTLPDTQNMQTAPTVVNETTSQAVCEEQQTIAKKKFATWKLVTIAVSVLLVIAVAVAAIVIPQINDKDDRAGKRRKTTTTTTTTSTTTEVSDPLDEGESKIDIIAGTNDSETDKTEEDKPSDNKTEDTYMYTQNGEENEYNRYNGYMNSDG